MKFIKTAKKSIYKIPALILILGMAVSLQAGASAESSANILNKEENIYVSLGGSGDFIKAYVVNEFEVESPGSIEDFGAYDSVYNLTTAGKLEVKDGRIHIADAPAGRFYYQGNMSKLELPWKINIKYFLNGEEIPAEKLTGAEGTLRIDISIAKNPEARGDFAEHYVLQTSLTLDSALCTGIEAEGASIANAGKNKLVNFTLLPGGEADYSITSEVTNFHMSGIQFSGIPLSMNIELPDNKLLNDKLVQFTGGIGQIDSGAFQISGSVKKLKDAAGKFHNGTENMETGISQLNESLKALTAKNPELQKGSADILNGFSEILSGLNGFGTVAADLTGLTKGSSNIREGMGNLSSGLIQLKGSFQTYKDNLEKNGLKAEDILGSNKRMIALLDVQIGEMKAQLAETDKGNENYAKLQTQITTFENISGILKGNTALISADREFIGQLQAGLDNTAAGAAALKENYAAFDAGIQSIPSKLDGLPENMVRLKEAMTAIKTGYEKLHNGILAYTEGAKEISLGQDTLYNSYSELSKGSKMLYTGISQLYEGTLQLAEGTGQLKKETSSMDSQIDKTIDELFGSYTGGDYRAVSFMSDSNTRVESVQFVMQTKSIAEKIDEPEVKYEKVKKSFRERILALFGL